MALPKIILVGHPGSQKIVKASKYLTSKYLPGFDVTYLNYKGDIEGWSNFVADYLRRLDDQDVVFALDDYLISEPIDLRLYTEAEAVMRSGNFFCVKLFHCTVEEHYQYSVTTQYTIWDRQQLIKLLCKDLIHTPWQFEIEGSRIISHKGVGLCPCIKYNTSSALSARWNGVDFSGLNQSDIEYIKEHLMEGKTVVFGGSGFLGQALIRRLIEKGELDILAVARNEGALVALKEKFPQISIMVGDIANQWDVQKAMSGALVVYLLSAMKHVGLAENDVQACLNTNITGVSNVIKESLISKPALLMFISSDKAAQPSGVYGCTKKIGERLMVEAEKINTDTWYRVIRYGNVWNSTGSIATKWKPKMEKGEEVIITDPKASRFFWTVDEAVDLIFECEQRAGDATPYIPEMKAVTMGTVLEACMEVWGKSPVKEIGLQPGENLVETTDGKVFSDSCEQWTKEGFKAKFLGVLSVEKQPEEKPKITAVLITREKEYPKIVAERLDTGFFDEIIVVTECESIYHRYLAAAKANSDILYVQDDDCMVNYQELFKHYDGRITNAMPKAFKEKYDPLECTLVGWGCFFPKSMLTGTFDKYIDKYGVDQHLLREADRIFTYANYPFNTVIMPHEDLPQTEEKMSLAPDHYTSMNEALLKMQSFYDRGKS